MRQAPRSVWSEDQEEPALWTADCANSNVNG